MKTGQELSILLEIHYLVGRMSGKLPNKVSFDHPISGI